MLGHLMFFMPPETRNGSKAAASVPVGTTIGDLPGMLGISKHEIQAVLVNETAVTDPEIGRAHV